MSTFNRFAINSFSLNGWVAWFGTGWLMRLDEFHLFPCLGRGETLCLVSKFPCYHGSLRVVRNCASPLFRLGVNLPKINEKKVCDYLNFSTLHSFEEAILLRFFYILYLRINKLI